VARAVLDELRCLRYIGTEEGPFVPEDYRTGPSLISSSMQSALARRRRRFTVRWIASFVAAGAVVGLYQQAVGAHGLWHLPALILLVLLVAPIILNGHTSRRCPQATPAHAAAAFNEVVGNLHASTLSLYGYAGIADRYFADHPVDREVFDALAASTDRTVAELVEASQLLVTA
jgi:hypothetical protein